MLNLRTFSGRRYRVAGRLPSPLADEFHQRLADRRFLPLTPLEEQTFGWVCADNLLLTRFDVDTVVRGDHAVFALRIDKRRVNARILRAMLDLEIRGRQKAAEDAGKTWRASRDERQQLRADLRETLLKETNPSVQVCTVVLHTKRRLLHVLTRGKGVNDLLVRLFADTFGAQLVPLTPWHRGGEILAGTDAAVELAGLERTTFAGTTAEPQAAPARLFAETPDPAGDPALEASR